MPVATPLLAVVAGAAIRTAPPARLAHLAAGTRPPPEVEVGAVDIARPAEPFLRDGLHHSLDIEVTEHEPRDGRGARIRSDRTAAGQ